MADGKLTKQQFNELLKQIRHRAISLPDLRELLEREVITPEQFERLKAAIGERAKRAIRRTRALSFYLAKFAFRITLFSIALFFYLTDRELLESFIMQPFFMRFTPLHVIWAIFMAIMISHLIPNNRLSMAWRKARETAYQPVRDYEEVDLLHFVQDQNVKAWRVLLVWLIFNAVFGLLYLFGVIHEIDLLMLTVFFFLSDYICILLWCPFQSIIMKNKCCINCRIYDWGHFMMFTPMLFIRNFFSWSLFFTSLVVLIHWELGYAHHPERFWEGSNKTLQCAHCKEQTCQIKRRLRGETADSRKA